MSRLRIAAVLIGLMTAAPATAERQRLDPSDVAALAKSGAGAGTSGVAGIVTTVLAGDPTKAGPYTIALSVPADTRIAAHTHRDDRSAIVVSGTWYFGYGAMADPAQAKPLPPGSFYTESANDPHFALTRETPVTVYISGFGPTDTEYVAADPPGT